MEIQFYAKVVDYFTLSSDDKVRLLSLLHTLNQKEIVRYFNSGSRRLLYVPKVKVYELPTPEKIKREELREKHGTVTWIYLPKEIEKTGLKPVLNEEEFAKKANLVNKLLERPVETLIRNLKDKDWSFREHAAWALGEIRDKRTVEPLTQALNDEDRRVREAAKEALRLIEENNAENS